MKKLETMRLRYKGTHNFTATAGQSTTSDWKITQESYSGQNVPCFMDGADYSCENAAYGDSIKFQVVDVDNLLGYGAGVVLDQFADIYVMPGANSIKEYAAALPAGLYVRMIYNSTGATNVNVICNLHRHIDIEAV